MTDNAVTSNAVTDSAVTSNAATGSAVTSNAATGSAIADCLFCRIVAGDIPSVQVLDTERVLAFRDVSPQAPFHVVVIPKAHFADIVELGAADPGLAGEVMAAVSTIAAQEGLADGFRLVFNTGADSGQTVGHVHGHVLGGRSLTWPPG